MKDLAYYNGEITPIADLKIPALDRAVYFGDGAYDVVSIFNGHFFALDDHVDRFVESLPLIGIESPLPCDEMKALFRSLLKKVDVFKTGTIYFQVSRGTSYRTHEFPDKDAKANLLVFIRESVFPDIKKPLNIITHPDLRHSLCNVKTLSILPNILASQKAKEAGCEEAALVLDGYITECSHTSIGIIKNGKMITRQLDCHVLPGIGRAHTIAICKSLGIPVEERPFSVGELFDADEILIMSCIKLCSFVGTVDGKPVGGKAKDIVEKIQQKYLEKIEKELEKD